MKKLSKEKRQQLVLVAMLTTGILAGLWFCLISYQKQNLRKLNTRKKDAERELQQVKQTISNADRVETQLGQTGAQLEKLEDTMAGGDLYAWAFNTIRQFKLGYKVEIPQFSQVDGPKDVSMLPRFPYKQATITVSGTAFYSDLGKFVADFENQFPYFRVLNLTLEPAAAIAATDREKLQFRMEIAALVRPGAS